MVQQDDAGVSDLRFTPPLWTMRRAHVSQLLLRHRNPEVKTVLDIGCGEGDVLQILLNSTAFTRLLGIDLRLDEIKACAENCQPTEYEKTYLRERPISLQLFVGSFEKIDSRLAGTDAIISAEVIEHLDPPQLKAFPEVIFGVYGPPLVIITTPNAEFNVFFPNLKYGSPESTLRNEDHRFEWTRAEFETWAEAQASIYGYSVEFSGVGKFPNAEIDVGYCTQVAAFTRLARGTTPPSPLTKSLELYTTIEYPHFVADTEFSPKQILDEAVAELGHLIYFDALHKINDASASVLSDEDFETELRLVWPRSGELTIDNDRLWSSLKIRQMCALPARFFEVLVSEEGQRLFACSRRDDFGPMVVLFELPFPDLRVPDEEQPESEEEQPESEDEEMEFHDGNDEENIAT